jgi:thiosulfate dehydrogenase [quinone] large subunit
MFVAFLESIKYVGHLLPLTLLRMYMGYYFLNSAIHRSQGDDLVQPRLAARVSEWIPQSPAPDWYLDILERMVIPNWKVFAYLVTYSEFVIGVSFLVGFLVRPTALLGMLLCLNFVYASGYPAVELHQTHFAVFMVLALMGAGRCLGFDYFFYKRQRGLWW